HVLPLLFARHTLIRLLLPFSLFSFFFFFHPTASPALYTLSLHDALPISNRDVVAITVAPSRSRFATTSAAIEPGDPPVTTATSPLCSKVEASTRACAAWVSRPKYSAITAASSPAPVMSKDSMSPCAKRTRSSRADAQRSSSC